MYAHACANTTPPFEKRPEEEGNLPLRQTRPSGKAQDDNKTTRSAPVFVGASRVLRTKRARTCLQACDRSGRPHIAGMSKRSR
jgi:hypothetical protein